MSRRPRDPEEKAAAADYAALKFKAWPEALAAVGTFAEWMERAREVYPSLHVALAVLKFDDEKLTALLQKAPNAEAMLAGLDWLATQIDAYTALVDIMKTAELRTIAALTRIELAAPLRA